MPTQPKPGETKDEFMERCVPEALEDGTANNNMQAADACALIYDEKRQAPFYEVMTQKRPKN